MNLPSSFGFFDDEDLANFRRSIARLARDEVAPHVAVLDAEERFCPKLTGTLARGGLLGCLVPKEYGGSGWGKREYLVALEEMARVDGSQAAFIASHNSLGVGSILAYGSEEQKKRYLPGLCKGELWGFALSEPGGGSDVGNTQSRARWDEALGQWVLSGEKSWITNTGHEQCVGVTVLAVTGEDDSGSKKKFSCFLVPLCSQGVSQELIKGKMMWRSTSTAHLKFSDVPLPPEALLGEEGRGFHQMMSLLDEGRLSLSALALGLSKEVFDLSLEYSQKRRSFSKALIAHQGVGFKLADMALKIETAQTLMLKALMCQGPSSRYTQLASMAKLHSSEVAEFCTREAQQIFAARGLIKPHVVERHFRDAVLLRIGEGTSEIQRMIISRLLKPFNE